MLVIVIMPVLLKLAPFLDTTQKKVGHSILFKTVDHLSQQTQTLYKQLILTGWSHSLSSLENCSIARASYTSGISSVVCAQWQLPSTSLAYTKKTQRSKPTYKCLPIYITFCILEVAWKHHSLCNVRLKAVQSRNDQKEINHIYTHLLY